ncbi:anthranilate synthase, component I [Candidatus Kryptonium thompsonii]|uniref:Anthranilate synthase component 1 n=2 Tax=Candidatus Kryptonium thompsonii TaxID=1633631 RepID=A0A0P1P1U2_9BACT|nr:anthranilate synthase component I [Candidatus Kryptonium thompsoni]CUS78678.1 anthranilate synthase, component I [Candidatus Kryptonium thompsoni]CUS83240.1 anthranilate synthase, component I [Candidatus Kryptonium thompsoni]CUS86990.1 anthranilate synthase, component I [Candidatus Kryptonium thompsoni]CUS95479.1 anthranilate synthase, component I [Candidatus Kryptonium thompsoni]CUT06252.1 anthranilate synthase, component I [Candidatus Kryptonium thompsoni]
MLLPYETFKLLAENGNVIPVYESLLADTETPVSVYMKIKDKSNFSFLLESVEGGEKIARYSFIGLRPFMLFEAKGMNFNLKIFDDKFSFVENVVKNEAHPLKALEKIFSLFRSVSTEDLPRFTCGAVGYFGYESASLIEKIPHAKIDDIEVPDILLMFFDSLLVFDNLKRKIFLISNVYKNGKESESELKDKYYTALGKIVELKSLLKKRVNPEISKVEIEDEFKFNMTKEEFIEKVEQVKRYIINGDIFQAVISQRGERRIEGDPFDIYRMLRVVNPSPYMYFLNMEDLKIIGSSPELLVRVENKIVETRPIAGTRRRGKSLEEDAKLEEELLNDEKEKAEHLMLVDLGRNDIGKISYFGTVRVDQFMIVEKYSHVMHIVSNISGKLRDDVSPIEALYACFPAGTVTGAPKIRAMEIIAELEPTKRGIYGGAIGYIDFSGNIDSCIAIRTIIMKGNKAFFQAGAGIVYDSIPEREYQETLDKLAATFKAVELLSENQM